MITLFVKTGCQYCARVLAVCHTRDIAIEEKNIANDTVAHELIALGGKRQVPFMVDGKTMMYESDDIAQYLEEKFSAPAVNPKVHFATGGSACPSWVSKVYTVKEGNS